MQAEAIKLTEVANENDTAKSVFEVLAGRERYRRETNLTRFHRALMNEGKKVSEDEFLALFKKLEAMGVGSLIVGRGNNPSRFKWFYSLKEVAKAAKSEQGLAAESKLNGKANTHVKQQKRTPSNVVIMDRVHIDRLLKALSEAIKK